MSLGMNTSHPGEKKTLGRVFLGVFCNKAWVGRMNFFQHAIQHPHEKTIGLILNAANWRGEFAQTMIFARLG
jgi:hypothetical protein